MADATTQCVDRIKSGSEDGIDLGQNASRCQWTGDQCGGCYACTAVSDLLPTNTGSTMASTTLTSVTNEFPIHADVGTSTSDDSTEQSPDYG